MTKRAPLFALLLSACVGGEAADVPIGEVATHVDDWRDEVMYQLMVDRFANGSAANDWRVNHDDQVLTAYKGGDWQGVIDRLDYLEELGVTALWISPIVRNVDTDAGIDGYHGYWAVDLEKVNPHFGDLATLRRMVEECHARNIKVVLDIVTNHLGQVFYYDINMNGTPDISIAGGYPVNPGDPGAGSRTPVTQITEYDPDYDARGVQSLTSLGEAGPAPIRFFDMPEIFRVPPQPEIFQRREAYNLRGRVIDWNDREQVVHGDFPGGLKDIDTTNPTVRSELIRVYSDWVLKLDLDGFRIDTVKHVEHEFWQVFARDVRARLAAAGKDRFLMFGEAFDGDDALVGSYTRPGELDSVFYFPQKFQVFDDVFANGGATSKIADLHAQRPINYGTEIQPGGIGIAPHRALVNFIDNHDVPRFLWRQPDTRALRAAMGFLMFEEGIPCLYYGTEQDFSGGNDPANREPLWWSDYATDGETFRWAARLIRVRKRYDALRRGEMRFTWTSDRTGDEEDAGVVAFERTEGEAYALVVINAQGNHPSATVFEGAAMAVGVPAGTVLADALTGDRFTVEPDGTVDVPVDAFQVRALVREAEYEAF
ncbi:MAG: alpha-amylase [Sandaracinus sp.]|nr:alpha-amylase [Sandaracinus sp.]